MGVSGSGKSTLGPRLAEALGCGFLEGDAFHDDHAIAKMTAGRPLCDEDRWPWLDRLGAAINAQVQANGVGVAACSALKRSYRDRLTRAIAAPVRFVLLDVESVALLRRLRDRPGHFMPPALLQSQLETLERPGADEPALVVDAARPLGALGETVLAWLAAAGPAPQAAPAPARPAHGDDR